MKMKVTIDNQTYQVEIEDVHTRPVIARVEGEAFEVWPEETASAGTETSAPAMSVPEPVQAPVPTSAAGGDQGGDAKSVTAPLPGVIVAILVNPGDQITRGQELCTLEAMKMKNAIRANRDGAIAQIEVSVGDQVGHGQVLMTFSD